MRTVCVFRIPVMRKIQYISRRKGNMQKKISNLPFKGTAAQAEALKKVIDANKHDKSRLMGVMQEAQGIYGYLPIEVQQMIADGILNPGFFALAFFLFYRLYDRMR